MAELLAGSTDFVARHATIAWLLIGVSISSIVMVTLLLPRIIAQLPADYFAASRCRSRERATILGGAKRIGRNVLGVVCVLAGIAMLFLPGQGVLTILIGVLLVDFPGKRALERAVVRREAIKTLLDRTRAKRGHPPLDLR
jgi:hypothetical protein